MSMAGDEPTVWAGCQATPGDGEPHTTYEPTSRTCFLQSLDNPHYDERVYNGSDRLRMISSAPCDPVPLPYLVGDEDDGLPCLELLLSDAFAAGCLAATACPPAPSSSSLSPPAVPRKRAATSKACTATTTKKRKASARPRRTAKAPSHRGETRTAKKQKQKHQRRSKSPDVVAEPGAADTTPTPSETEHPQEAGRPVDANPYASMLARSGLARVLPRTAMTLPVTWYHQPPCPSSSQHSPPPIRLYRRSAAAAALASLCHAVRINVSVNASLDRAIDAVLSIPHALADARRPHDAEATTRVGWVALMGNHDRSSFAGRITPLWAGRTASLASSGLDIVAPTHAPDDVTPEQRAMRVLSTEAHMPWFAARVRAVAHETLMGTPSLLGCGLFDLLPVDTFLVLDLDAHGVARPYDIYVVPRVDLLTSRLTPG